MLMQVRKQSKSEKAIEKSILACQHGAKVQLFDKTFSDNTFSKNNFMFALQ